MSLKTVRAGSGSEVPKSIKTVLKKKCIESPIGSVSESICNEQTKVLLKLFSSSILNLETSNQKCARNENVFKGPGTLELRLL